jgi:hypothetical protein
VDQGFAQADHVFEHRFKVQPVMHVPLEPMVSLAEPEGDGVLIHSATQMPSFVRLEIARLLGWSEKAGIVFAFLSSPFYCSTASSAPVPHLPAVQNNTHSTSASFPCLPSHQDCPPCRASPPCKTTLIDNTHSTSVSFLCLKAQDYWTSML